ncbi:L-ascorbate oxidase-like [Tasmannia lanceolata]|uniref:L-ascorbate oxidase-like n=1 Tax=Tasmannia lanceolata TaxID=3420 RepID=UPI00406297A0
MGTLLDFPRFLLTSLVLVFFIFLTTPTIEAKIRRYNWEVKYKYMSPDCYQKLVIAVNGKSPGPTILAQAGDMIIVNLKNGLITENVAVHWHGIRQIGTPWSDGTEGVTQCPILPGDTFQYKFVVDRPGTYLYHAHYGMQREAGLYGSIRVSVRDGENEPFSYDEDRSIILNDWWHNSTLVQATGLSSIPFQWVNEPQSLLIQGRGIFNCSQLSPSSSDTGICNNTKCYPYHLTVVPGRTYRLRIASLTSLSALNFEIEGHNMTIVEADGYYVEPFVVKNLNIYSGETYSVLVKADQDPSRNYWAVTNVVSRPRKPPPGLAIFNYYPNHPRKSPSTPPPTGPQWDDTDYRINQSLKIKAHRDYIHKPPQTSDRTIILLNTQNTINGYTKWSLNNVSHIFPETPYLIAIKENLPHAFDQNPPPETYDYKNYDIYGKPNNTNATFGNGIYRLEFNSTVDIILQNANMMKEHSNDTHPWHLHGHDFWVLGYGKGKFDPANHTKFNLVDPIMKNTVPLHQYSWTAIRFIANNPGTWAFHCHIESHFYMGMSVVFAEGVDRVGKLPDSIMGCGETKGLRRP